MTQLHYQQSETNQTETMQLNNMFTSLNVLKSRSTAQNKLHASNMPLCMQKEIKFGFIILAGFSFSFGSKSAALFLKTS